MNTENHMDKLVRAIAEKCFYGSLPACPDLLVDAVVACIPALRDASPEELEPFVVKFLESVYFRLILEVESVLGYDLDPPSETVN